jgi:hypothetical protein
MSIEYHVEGNIKITSKGDNILMSKETIAHSSNGQIVYNGKENGVLYKKNKTLHPTDSISNSTDLSINIFFDGTQNNRTNTLSREQNNAVYKKEGNKKDDSYENDYTNVARGYDITDDKNQPRQGKVYIEGVATEDNQDDDSVSLGVGISKEQIIGIGIGTGIAEKVTKACEKGALKVKEKFRNIKKDKLHTLYVNVYGFSRGAATARHFIHVASNPAFIEDGFSGKHIWSPTNKLFKIEEEHPLYSKHGYFGYCLVQNGVIPEKIVFNFVRLYDTVSSEGLYHGNDVKELGLDAVKKAHMVFQIAADDEYRENFDLTNINSAGLHGLELTLPGVHSDIGGSYRPHTVEKSVIFQGIGEGEKLKAEKYRDILIKEGWFKKNQIYITSELTKSKEPQSEYTLRGIRTLENTYDKIPLNMMVKMAEQFEVLFDQALKNDKTVISDPLVSKAYTQLQGYAKKCSDYRNECIGNNAAATYQSYLRKNKKISYLHYIELEVLQELRNRYFHWSVNADSFGLQERTNALGMTPGPQTFDKRKREIHNG